MSSITRKANLKELADSIGAEFCGEPLTTISAIATLERAQKNELSFFANRKYYQCLLVTKASIVILHPDDQAVCPTNTILSPEPYLAYAKIATWLTQSNKQQSKIASTAIISNTVMMGNNTIIADHVTIESGCKIGNNVTIHAGCVLSDSVTIGDDTTLYPNVSIYSGVTLGSECIIHSGVVIGSDGFGIANEQGKWIKVPQLGSVIIGNRVEIGANTTIDRGAIDNTIIEDGVKLDNQIQVAHNVHIGENTVIAGCVGIAGSSTIGKSCAIGGGAGILGHLTIADGVHITATSLVTKSIHKTGIYSSGTPLQESSLWHKNFVRFKQLDKIARRLTKLEKI